MAKKKAKEMPKCPLNKTNCISCEDGICINTLANVSLISKVKHCKLYKSK